MFCSDTSNQEYSLRYGVRYSNISIYGRVEVERVWNIEREAAATLKLKPETTIINTKNREEAGLF